MRKTIDSKPINKLEEDKKRVLGYFEKALPLNSSDKVSVNFYYKGNVIALKELIKEKIIKIIKIYEPYKTLYIYKNNYFSMKCLGGGEEYLVPEGIANKKYVSKETKETKIDIEYSKENKQILIKASGDFKHHLIEDIIITLGQEFDMLDHVYLGGINSKNKSDDR